MKIDWEEAICFYLRFVYVFISHTASKGISMDGTVYKWSKVEKLWLQQSGSNHIKAFKIVKYVRFSQSCQWNPQERCSWTLPETLQSAPNASCFDNHIYYTPKQLFRTALVSQSIVLKFLKEVWTQLRN